MLKRVRPDVLGTVECRCAPEKRIRPPDGHITRVSGSSCNGPVAFGWRRVSAFTSFAAFARPVLFQS